MGLKTSDLVFHFCGFANAGEGKHDTMATSWVDLSGNGYDGILVSGGTWGNNYLNFNGTNYVRLLDAHNYTPFTLELYFSHNNYSSSHKSICGNYQNGGYGFQLSSNTQGQMLAYVSSDSDYSTTQFYLTPQTKNHAVITYDSQTLKVYFNGVLISSIQKTANIKLPTDNAVFMIGADPSNATKGTNPFYGKIYSCRMYDTALTADEVIGNYLYCVGRYSDIVDQTSITGEVAKVYTDGLYNLKDEKARLEKIDRYIDGKATAVVNFLNGIKINGGKIYYDSTKDTVYFE